MLIDRKTIRVLSCGLLLGIQALCSACGGGGGPPGSGGGKPDRGAMRLAAIPGAGPVIENVLEQGDRFEMTFDPAEQTALSQSMLAVMVGEWIDGGVLYEFRADGYWRRTDSDPFGYIQLYSIGHYYRPGSSTPLMAASVHMQFDPQFIVVINNDALAIAFEDSYGDTLTGLFGRY